MRRLVGWVALAAAITIGCTPTSGGPSPAHGSDAKDGGTANAADPSAPGATASDHFWFNGPGSIPPDDFLYTFQILKESPGYAGDIVGRWAFSEGGQMSTLMSTNGFEDLLRIDSHGLTYMMTFFADGTYGLLYMSSTSYGCAKSGSVLLVAERGKYTLDGSAMTMTPNGYDWTARVCDGAPDSQKEQAPPRTYTVASAVYQQTTLYGGGKTSSGIVLRGPCGAYVEHEGCTIMLQRVDGKPTGIHGPRGLDQSCGPEDPCIESLTCVSDIPGNRCTRSCASNADCLHVDGSCMTGGVCGAPCYPKNPKPCRTGLTCIPTEGPYSTGSVGNCVHE